MGTWAAGSAAAPAIGVVPHTSSVWMAGEESDSSWWKTTWHMTSEALVATALFFPTLVMGLEEVLALGLALDAGDRKGSGCSIGLRGRCSYRVGRPVGTRRSQPVCTLLSENNQSIFIDYMVPLKLGRIMYRISYYC